MNYQQRLASALVAFGDGDEAAAFAELDLALAEAERVDPDGPRVAEVLNYAAQLHQQAGRLEPALAALTRVAAIWERFPELSAGLEDFYLQLMGLCVQLGRQDAAAQWQVRARAAAVERSEKPWR